MSISRSIDRREFIKVASTGGAGLILAIYLPACKKLEASRNDTASPVSPNAWIAIAPDGIVTITVARSEMGQGVRTSLPMIVAEELDADWSMVRIVQAPADPQRFGSQATGGSSSVRNSYAMLRNAGAAARAMLVAAAAQEWGVPAGSCSTKEGMVIHPATGKQVSYGAVADASARMPLPENPPLKDAANFRILGTKIPRLDIPSKVNGGAVFGIDAKVPGMLYACVARSRVFGGKVIRFDASKAKMIHGVKDVVRIDEGIVVIADSTWAAMEGRNALTVEWRAGDYADQSSAAIWQKFEEAAKGDGEVERNDGNFQSTLHSAAIKLEAVYRAPFAAHVTIEPMNCLADTRKDACEIWAPSQTPQDAQSEATGVLDLPVEKVKVNVSLLGGGFGRRLENDYVVEAVKISKAIGSPVKVVWTREDDMRHDLYRPATYNVLRAALDNDGGPLGWFHRIVGPSAKGLVVSGSHLMYDIANVYVDSHIVETGVPIGAWRSVGYSQNAFVIEGFIDELAHAGGKDPVEFRRKLLGNAPRLRGVLDLAAEKAGWGKKLPAGSGHGVALVQGFGSSVAEIAEVSVDETTGKVHVDRVVCAVDCGPVVNPDTIEAQLESAVAFGLTVALKDEITINKGGIVQGNFDDYDILRMNEMPTVEVYIVPSTDTMGGIGEPGVPPIAPAVCNAIFAATGKRLRQLPIRANDLRKA